MYKPPLKDDPTGYAHTIIHLWIIMFATSFPHTVHAYDLKLYAYTCTRFIDYVLQVSWLSLPFVSINKLVSEIDPLLYNLGVIIIIITLIFNYAYSSVLSYMYTIIIYKTKSYWAYQSQLLSRCKVVPKLTVTSQESLNICHNNSQCRRSAP